MSRLTAVRITSRSDIASLVRELEQAVEKGPVTLGVIPRADLTPTEAGTMLGVSRQFVDRLISQGQLSCVRLPGSTHRRIPTEEVARFQKDRARRRSAHAKAVRKLDATGVPWE
jgi:excisionase family DNA binding protein